jgi:hypothetical protein
MSRCFRLNQFIRHGALMPPCGLAESQGRYQVISLRIMAAGAAHAVFEHQAARDWETFSRCEHAN